MKRSLILLIISVICLQCSAQKRLAVGEMKGKRKTFVIKKLGELDAVSYINVHSTDNLYPNGIPYPKGGFIPMNPRDKHLNTEEIKSLIFKVLDSKRVALHQNKETIGMTLVFDKAGTIVNSSFSLHENTIITAQDIEAIDQQMRANIKASFTGKQYLQYEAINSNGIPTIVF